MLSTAGIDLFGNRYSCVLAVIPAKAGIQMERATNIAPSSFGRSFRTRAGVRVNITFPRAVNEVKRNLRVDGLT